MHFTQTVRFYLRIILAIMSHYTYFSLQDITVCICKGSTQFFSVRYTLNYIYIYIYIYVYIIIYRMSQEERAKLRESVPYVKLYRYNPKHLYPKLNGYGDNGQRKVWTSCISAFYTSTAVSRATPSSSHMTACRVYVG